LTKIFMVDENVKLTKRRLMKQLLTKLSGDKTT